MGQAAIKVFKIFSTSLIKNIIQIFLALAITPFIIKALGAELFGATKVITEIYGHLTLLEFGLYGGLIAALISTIGKNDSKEFNKVFYWGRKYYFQIALIAFVISLLLTPVYYKIVNLGEEFKWDTLLAIFIISLNALLIPSQVYRIKLEAEGEGHKIQVSQLVQSLIYSFLALAFAKYIPSISLQILAVTLSTFCGALLIFKLANFRLNVNQIKEAKLVDPNFKKNLRQKQLHQFLNDLAGKVCLFADNIIISWFMGPSFVTSFYLTQRAALIIQVQLQSVSHATWPTMAAHFSRGGEGKIHFENSFVSTIRILGVLAIATLIPYVILNSSFIKLWVPMGEYGGDTLTLITAINAYFLSLFSIWGWCFTSAGKVQLLTPMMLVQALVNLAVGIYTTKNYGVMGPAMGTLVAFLLVPFTWLPYALNKYFEISYKKFIPDLFGQILLALFLFFLTKKIYSMIQLPNNWGTFFIHGAIQLIILGLISSLLLLRKDEWTLLFSLLKKITEKKS